MEWHTSGPAPTFGFDELSHQLQVVLGLRLEVKCLVESQISRLVFLMSDFVTWERLLVSCLLTISFACHLRRRVWTFFVWKRLGRCGCIFFLLAAGKFPCLVIWEYQICFCSLITVSSFLCNFSHEDQGTWPPGRLQVEDVVILNTKSGIQIKTTAGRGGYIVNVSISTIEMHYTEKAIVFTGFSGKHPDDNWDRKAYPLVEQIWIKNVVGENIMQAGELLGLQEAPFRDICLINIALDVISGWPYWNCSEVVGSSSYVLPKPCPELQDSVLSSSKRWRRLMNGVDFQFLFLASFQIVKGVGIFYLTQNELRYQRHTSSLSVPLLQSRFLTPFFWDFYSSDYLVSSHIHHLVQEPFSTLPKGVPALISILHCQSMIPFLSGCCSTAFH